MVFCRISLLRHSCDAMSEMRRACECTYVATSWDTSLKRFRVNKCILIAYQQKEYTNVDAYPSTSSLPHPSATASHVCDRNSAVHSHGTTHGASHDDADARSKNILLVHLAPRGDDTSLSHERGNVFGHRERRPGGGDGSAPVLTRIVVDQRERREE